MKKVVDFPDVKAKREAYLEKLESIGLCQQLLADVVHDMRQLGANDVQIALILRHAAKELDAPL